MQPFSELRALSANVCRFGKYLISVGDDSVGAQSHSSHSRHSEKQRKWTNFEEVLFELTEKRGSHAAAAQRKKMRQKKGRILFFGFFLFSYFFSFFSSSSSFPSH